jgi:hypothetical protein
MPMNIQVNPHTWTQHIGPFISYFL